MARLDRVTYAICPVVITIRVAIAALSIASITPAIPGKVKVLCRRPCRTPPL